MKKRMLASMIALSLGVSLLPYKVFANLQSAIGGISGNSIVGHTNEMGKIVPRVELMFEEPTPSDLEDSSTEDGGIKHGLDKYYYQVDIKEHPGGKGLKSPETPKQLSDLKIPAGTTLTNGIPVQGLDNGKLYRMAIIPYHYHTYRDGSGEAKQGWAPRTAITDPYEYVLTDFDTRMEGKGGSLEVTWEDTGYTDMRYEIGYIQGNYEGQSLESIKGNNTGNNIQYIAAEDIKKNAKKYTDSQTGRARFRYVVDNNIATGQMYSAYVLSTTDKINNKEIIKNRETPKIVTATTEIGLNVYNAGKDKVRLEWDAQLIHVMDGEYELEQTQIKEFSIGKDSGRIIATLYGKDGADIGYYEYREPKESTYYQLIFIYKHKITGQMLIPQPQTAKVLYVPGELRTKPATPEIPKPIGPNTVVTSENKSEFLVPNDSLPDVALIDFWKSNHTFHANVSKPANLNFVWSAYKGDLSLLYDIWITDDIAITKSEVAPIVQDLAFSNGQNPDGIIYDQAKEGVLGFKYTIREYYNSAAQRVPILANKVYYVKIVAKKAYGDELEPSLPATVAIIFDSDGEIFSPPVISKPPLKLDPNSVKKTSITISWLETWYEIMAKYPMAYPAEEQKKAKDWNSKVYTTGPSISFINKEGSTEHILKREQNIGILKSIVGNEKYDENYIDRIVKLGKNVNYEYMFMPYDEILQGLETHNLTSTSKKTVEEYIEMLMKEEESQNYGWKKIIPKTTEDEEYTQWKQHTQDNLKPNTSYVFFVRPSSQDYDGSKLQAALPTWIVATTLPDGDMPEGKPTVPMLSLNGKSDSYISVEWEYNSAFEYEIRYSQLENPEIALVHSFKIATDVSDPTYVANGGKAVITIDGLFPETTYNVWIRAKQKKGQQISAWSNPVTAKTDLLGTPTSPAGLGIASYQSILEIGRDFQPVSTDYITVEWQRNAIDKELDKLNQDNQRVYKEYKYMIEIADNPEFIDMQKVTVNKETAGSKVANIEILSRSMVSFGELIANRPYYVRAKTILIAHDKENDREIVKESEYTQFVRIITKPSQSEYDGGDKMNEVIYPNKIEETYDGTTWIYQILDTQKVINEMVTGNQFRYVVPVRKYKDRYDAKFRIIRIPQPVVTTLLNRRMELEIRTNILSIQIPAKALEAHMIGTSADGMVEFMFETLSANDLYGMGNGYEYGFLSRPEKMSITVKGPRGVTALNKIDALLNIKINMPYQVDYMNKNLGGYTYDTLEGIWKKGNHQFDKISMQLGYTSGTIGTYAVYEKTRVPTAQESITQSMRNVVKQHDVVGLGTKYTPYMKVSTLEYINIMLGIAEKKSQIKPDMYPTKEEVYRAKNAGIYVNELGTTLTQEAAISGVVRLYELINGISVRSKTNENVSLVTEAYRSNIQKAYTIGLISNISPQQPITYGELFNLIEQVIE